VLSVRALRENPLTGLLRSTVALLTTAPEGSTTVPITKVELPDWARATELKIRKNMSNKVAVRDFT
jgi:hypothetical protein